MLESAPITWFTEDPTPIFILGGITLAVLFVYLMKTGRGLVLVAMAAVAAFMGLAVLVDAIVVTDRERVENVIYEAAAAAEQHNLDEVTALVSASAPQIKADIRHWLRDQLIIESVTIGNLDVSVDRTTSPPTATAKFWYIGQGKWRRGDTVHDRVPGKLKVDFRKEGERWLVTAYEPL
jgi:hypothetical protein